MNNSESERGVGCSLALITVPFCLESDARNEALYSIKRKSIWVVGRRKSELAALIVPMQRGMLSSTRNLPDLSRCSVAFTVLVIQLHAEANS